MTKKTRYKGPNGAIFVPGRLIDERTLRARVKSGEWTPTDEIPPPKAKAKPAKAGKTEAGKTE